MGLSLGQTHARYLQQAGWTAALRAHLFARAGLAGSKKVLEVGSGTGAVLGEMEQPAFGLDIHWPSLQFSELNVEGACLTAGDGHRLPYAAGSFDLVYCHFLLLWVKDPGRVLAEMVRVTRAGGVIMALAEPDYGGRIDYPDELKALGSMQRDSLAAQGADTKMGRKLTGLFSAAGLEDVEVGVMGAQWLVGDDKDHALERQVLEADLEGQVDTLALEQMLDVEERAWEQGERVLYVPTFYAWGKLAETTTA